MIYLTEQMIETKIEDFNFIKDFSFEKTDDNVIFKINDEMTIMFPVEHRKLHQAIDQIIMTGHYLYGKNDEFRDAYRKVYNGREFNINYRTLHEGRHVFTKNLFSLFLYGINASTYINSLPDKPFHYFARPVRDEKNPSLEQFMKDEHIKDIKYRKMDGTPFYNYIMKKSFVMPTNNLANGDIHICPITDIMKDVKNISSNINKLAVYVFTNLMNSGIDEYVMFCKSFIDSSWSPYLKAN